MITMIPVGMQKCAYHPLFMYAAARFPYRTAAEGQQLIALLYRLMANV